MDNLQGPVGERHDSFLLGVLVVSSIPEGLGLADLGIPS